MYYEVVGFKMFEYTSKNTGALISACRLYVLSERTDVQGKVAEEVFFTRDKLGGYSPTIGDVVQIYYNRFGKAEGIGR